MNKPVPDRVHRADPFGAFNESDAEPEPEVSAAANIDMATWLALGLSPSTLPSAAPVAGPAHGRGGRENEADALLTRAEIDAVRATLDTFRANNIRSRDHESTLQFGLTIARLGCGYRHVPGVKDGEADSLRQRIRSWTFAIGGCKWRQLHGVALASGVWRPARLKELNSVCVWGEQLRKRVLGQRRRIAAELLRRASGGPA